jgi:hypothetical protein
MRAFDLSPFVGALPIAFGMTRDDVHAILYLPDSSSPIWDKSGTCDRWHTLRMNVGYDNSGIVNHVGFGPGGVILRILGSELWTDANQPDPNPTLLKLDPNPLERVGFLFFTRLGIKTAGYHDDDDESQRAITVNPRGTHDDFLKRASSPDLSRYKQQT